MDTLGGKSVVLSWNLRSERRIFADSSTLWTHWVEKVLYCRGICGPRDVLLRRLRLKPFKAWSRGRPKKYERPDYGGILVVLKMERSGEIWRDRKTSVEICRDLERSGEIWRDQQKSGEIWRAGEISRDLQRSGEI